LSPQLQRIRKEEEENAKARIGLTARRMQRRLEQIRQDAIDRIQREEQARRDLEEHQRRLADEIDQAVARAQPNPWLKPWDPGYESPTLIGLRQAAEAPPVGPVDIDAIRQKMHSRLAEIRRRNTSRDVSAGKPARPTATKKEYPSFVDSLRAVTPEKVAALAPWKREARRRWIESNTRGVVRTTTTNWRIGP
jgi:hypothetical protein